MNLQDRIAGILNDYCSSAFESDRALAAKAILALVEPPTVSEHCCDKCRGEYDHDEGTICENPYCPCHSPSSGVEPTAPVGEIHDILMPCELVPDLEAQVTNQIKDLIATAIKNRERGIAEGVENLTKTPKFRGNPFAELKEQDHHYNSAIADALDVINKQ